MLLQGWVGLDVGVEEEGEKQIWMQVEKSGRGLFYGIRPSEEWVWLIHHSAEELLHQLHNPILGPLPLEVSRSINLKFCDIIIII